MNKRHLLTVPFAQRDNLVTLGLMYVELIRELLLLLL